MSLIVQLVRPQFSDFFQVYCDDGITEELEAEELRTWFKVRNADMDVVEKAMDRAWNFSTDKDSSRKTWFEIKNPTKPKAQTNKLTPELY